MPKRLRKIGTFLNDYFIFSSGERKGVIVLLLVLIFLVSLPFLYGLVVPDPTLEVQFTDIPSTPLGYEETDENPGSDRPSALFRFDPNTATAAQLRELGFTEKNVTTIRKYLTKGGHFRKPADLGKIYGIRPQLFSQLEPYIAIHPVTMKADSLRSKKGLVRKVVELNSADSASLVALYRIGPALAHRILEYRQKLGGYLRLDQLTEIWGFDEDILYDLDGQLIVDASKATVFDVNTVSADQLKTHPYFKFKLANAVVNYRQQHGSYKTMQELRGIVLVNDSVYDRITQYLRIGNP